MIIKGSMCFSEKIFISCSDKSNEKAYPSFFFFSKLYVERTIKANINSIVANLAALLKSPKPNHAL